MSDEARVSSVEAVQHFYAAVRVFQDEAETALLSLDQQVAKVLAWYDYDAPHYWKEQVKRCYDEVSQARSTYDTCRMRTVAGHRPACDVEKQALATAKRRLEFSQQQIEVVKCWAIRLHRVIDEFRGHSGRFQHYLETDVEKTAALLGRTVASLETYLGHGINEDGTASPADSADSQRNRENTP